MAKWIDRVLKAEETAIRARRLEQEVDMLHGSLQAMHNTVTSVQASTDIETNTTDITDNKHYTGNKYATYEDQVTALANKYNNTADWGCQTTKNIIDVRAAFCIGRGVQVKVRAGYEGKADREVKFLREFIHFNKMDDRKPSDWAKEAEIEGKVLFRFKFQSNAEGRFIRVWHVPWRDVKYKVANTPDDYETYTRAWYTGTVAVERGPNRTESVDITFDVGPEEFVFARFGGGGKDTTNTPPKTAFVLDQTENLDKELWDWRKINHLFAAPTPVFEFDAECADEARALDKTLKTNNWRIGKYIVLAGGRFHLETYSGEGFTTIQKAIEADVQAISGSTGVPVHFLGHPNLLSNRACYSEDTETLTENGWKRYTEVGEDEAIACFDPETGGMVFEVPKSRHVYTYSGDMVHFESDRNDILVTPDHKMWANRAWNGYTQGGRSWGKIEAEELAKDFWVRFRTSTTWGAGTDIAQFEVGPHDSARGKRDEQPTIFDADTFLEFLGYYLSEGGTGTYKTTSENPNQFHTITHIAQKVGEKADTMRGCLDRLGLRYNEHTADDGVVRWHIHHSGLHQWLKDNMGGNHLLKDIPKSLRGLSSRQLRILFDALMLGDGFWDKRANRTSGLYYTTSSKLADGVQELALKLGYSARVKVIQDPRGGNRATEYRVYIRAGKDSRMKGSQIKRVPYNGVVYCFATTTGLFFTRRNGKVAIQGNTAENLMELIELSTDKERDTWTATYTEMFQKAIRMWNAAAQTDLDPDAVEAVIPFAGGQNLEAVANVYLPMYIAGAMSLPTLLSKLVGVDLDTELVKIEEERKAKEEREMKLEEARAKNAAISSGGTTGNGRVTGSRDGGRDVAGRRQGN